MGKNAIFKKHPQKVLLLAILLIPILLGGLNHSGMCLKKGRWLNSEEKILAALNYHMNRISIPVYTRGRGYLRADNYKQIFYQNPQEYLAQHPDCCVLNTQEPHDMQKPSLWGHLSGAFGGVVVLDYSFRYLDESGAERMGKTKFENQISNCGDIKTN